MLYLLNVTLITLNNREDLKSKAAEVIGNPSWLIFPEVKDFCLRYQELSSKFGAAVGEVVANKEIEEIARSVKTLVSQLEKGKSSRLIPLCTKAHLTFIFR